MQTGNQRYIDDITHITDKGINKLGCRNILDICCGRVPKLAQGRHICEPGHEKMFLMSYANNKGADQPARPRSLISAFIVRCLYSIISLDSIAEVSRL